MLQKFLYKPEHEQNNHRHLETGTHFAAAFSAESLDEEIDFNEEVRDPITRIMQPPQEDRIPEKIE